MSIAETTDNRVCDVRKLATSKRSLSIASSNERGSYSGLAKKAQKVEINP